MGFAAIVYVTINGVASKPVVKSGITARREKYFIFILIILIACQKS